MGFLLALVLIQGFIYTTAGAVGDGFDARLKRFIFQGGGNGGGPGGAFPNSPFGGGGTSTSGNEYHACVPSHSVCYLQCPTGYMKGPNNCDFCMCGSSNTGNVASSSPGGPTTKALPVAMTTGVPNTTRDPCILAKTLCATRCGAGGYLADPDDCTFCVCKSDIESSG